jgi:hypothetical protein
MIGDDSNLSVVRDALAAVVGGGWQIEVGNDGTSGTAGRGGTPASQPGVAEPSSNAVAPDDGVDEDSDAVEGTARNGADPEAAAIALLQDSLGARPIES